MKHLKLPLILVTLILTVTCCVSCIPIDFLGESSNSDIPQITVDKTKLQFECGKKAYDELILAADICEYIGDAVYGAWYFAIYSDGYGLGYNADLALQDLSDEVGISVSDLKVAATVYLGEELDDYVQIYLDDFDCTVDMTIIALEENGTIDKLNTALGNAKAELKTMTAEYSDYSEYPNLKSLYSKVDSYATFLKSPTGSFEQLATTLEKYETEIRTLRSDLEFVFED